MDTREDPARAVLERLALPGEEICASEPPVGWGGDCWCTLPVDHPEVECCCQICTLRHGAPGWVVAR